MSQFCGWPSCSSRNASGHVPSHPSRCSTNPWASSTGGCSGWSKGSQAALGIGLGISPHPDVEILAELHQLLPVPQQCRGSSRGLGCSVWPYLQLLPTLLIPREGPIPGEIPVPLPLPAHGTLSCTSGPAKPFGQHPSPIPLPFRDPQDPPRAFWCTLLSSFLHSVEVCLSLLGPTRNPYLMRMSQSISTRRWEVKGTGFISNRAKILINKG